MSLYLRIGFVTKAKTNEDLAKSFVTKLLNSDLVDLQ